MSLKIIVFIVIIGTYSFPVHSQENSSGKSGIMSSSALEYDRSRSNVNQKKTVKILSGVALGIAGLFVVVHSAGPVMCSEVSFGGEGKECEKPSAGGQVAGLLMILSGLGLIVWGAGS